MQCYKNYRCGDGQEYCETNGKTACCDIDDGDDDSSVSAVGIV